MFQLDSEVVELRIRSVRLGHNLVGVWRHEVVDLSCDLLALLYVGSVQRQNGEKRRVSCMHGDQKPFVLIPHTLYKYN